jgi:hypothetical protein
VSRHTANASEPVRSVSGLVASWRHHTNTLVSARDVLDRHVQQVLCTILFNWHLHAHSTTTLKRRITTKRLCVARARMRGAFTHWAAVMQARQQCKAHVVALVLFRGRVLLRGSWSEWAREAEKRKVLLLRQLQWWAQHKMVCFSSDRAQAGHEDHNHSGISSLSSANAGLRSSVTSSASFLPSLPTAAALWLGRVRSGGQDEGRGSSRRVPKSVLSQAVARWATVALQRLKRQVRTCAGRRVYVFIEMVDFCSVFGCCKAAVFDPITDTQASMIIRFCGVASRQKDRRNVSRSQHVLQHAALLDTQAMYSEIETLEERLLNQHEHVEEPKSLQEPDDPLTFSSASDKHLKEEELRHASQGFVTRVREHLKEEELRHTSPEIGALMREELEDLSFMSDFLAAGTEHERVEQDQDDRAPLRQQTNPDRAHTRNNSMARLDAEREQPEQSLLAGDCLSRLDQVAGGKLEPVQYRSPHIDSTVSPKARASLPLTASYSGLAAPELPTVWMEGCEQESLGTPHGRSSGRSTQVRFSDSPSTFLLTPRTPVLPMGDSKLVLLAQAAISSPSHMHAISPMPPEPQKPPQAQPSEPHPMHPPTAIDRNGGNSHSSREGASEGPSSSRKTVLVGHATEADFRRWLDSLKKSSK